MKHHILTTIATLTLLTACGGGDSDDNAPADKPQSNNGKVPTGKYFSPETDWDKGYEAFREFSWQRNGQTFATSEVNKGHTVDSAKLPAGFSEFPAQLTITRSNGQQVAENVTVRHEGKGLCGVYQKDIADTKHQQVQNLTRSEERRVGKECRSRWSPYH